MAVKKGARIVDLHAEFPVSLLGEDGLHPTEAGYQKIAEIFHDAIAAHYEVVPAARLQP
jgi:lysophospholipase L1-like esterase